MKLVVGDLPVHYSEHGTGTPLVALHGAGVDHREIEAAIEAVIDRMAPQHGIRRIYPDLPGMGRTPATGLSSNDDVVSLLADFIQEATGEPALLLGHSYGAYLARGIAARHPESVRGLALVCPVGERTGAVPPRSVVRSEADAYDELAPGQRAGFDDYFVVRTPDTARRYRDHVAPGVACADEDGLGRIFAGWRIDLPDVRFDRPTLIVAGRRDATAGYAAAMDLLEHYPRATLAVLDDAGHALPHEQPEQLLALLDDWLTRADAR